ncbi:thioredoxin family protein [Lutibacter sp. TH_r2]|uniref:thioredoxin family protein n=1 Tax=Lutibacter sp. TH_r2 TaxID=3082083 RepID=UPI0029530340|nr:thioredoxin family protein [Lutibacter sp. TH_r2]MDV7187108.1 thioredoxin family protein [Lutibacter sp. TH_r2]
MRKIFLSCLIVVGSICFIHAQDSVEVASNLDWEQSFKKAEKISKKKNKPILIFFTGSDWCGPCKMLVEDFFNTSKFGQLSDKFVLYEADFPRSTDLVTKEQQAYNKQLQSKYKIHSYPTIVVVGSNGNEISRKKGYNLMRDSSYHFSFIESIIK